MVVKLAEAPVRVLPTLSVPLIVQGPITENVPLNVQGPDNETALELPIWVSVPVMVVFVVFTPPKEAVPPVKAPCTLSVLAHCVGPYNVVAPASKTALEEPV